MKKALDNIKILKELSEDVRDIRYWTEFLLLSCGADLQRLRLFPNAKELSESMGCFDAVRRNLPVGWSFSENITCLSLADGSSPRTGALFSFMTKWNVISCDPEMREDHIERCKTVERLTCYKSIAEEIPQIKVNKACIVAVHAHNNVKAKRDKGNILEAGLEKVVADEYLVIALPCCNDLRISGINFIKEYRDLGIWSEKNIIRIWSFNREEWERAKTKKEENVHRLGK